MFLFLFHTCCQQSSSTIICKAALTYDIAFAYCNEAIGYCLCCFEPSQAHCTFNCSTVNSPTLVSQTLFGLQPSKFNLTWVSVQNETHITYNWKTTAWQIPLKTVLHQDYQLLSFFSAWIKYFLFFCPFFLCSSSKLDGELELLQCWEMLSAIGKIINLRNHWMMVLN